MVENHDIEALAANYRGLAPEQRTLLRGRAKALRAEFLRDLFRQLWSWRRRKVSLRSPN